MKFLSRKLLVALAAMAALLLIYKVVPPESVSEAIGTLKWIVLGYLSAQGGTDVAGALKKRKEG